MYDSEICSVYGCQYYGKYQNGCGWVEWVPQFHVLKRNSSIMQPVSHQWIIDCCKQNEPLKCEKFVFPSGWSLIDEHNVEWKVSRSKNSKSRASTKALRKKVVLIASQHNDYSAFWQRVCELAGGEAIVIRSLGDITDKTKGVLLTDEDSTEEVKAKAEHFRIPVVSTVWVVQSLIMGYAVDPDSNPKLKMPHDDEDYWNWIFLV